MKIKSLLLLLLCISTFACKNKETIETPQAENRKNILDKTTSMNIVLWMQKKPDIISLYNNKGQDGVEGFTSNVDFKKRLTNYHQCEIADIKLMSYEFVDETQMWTYRIVQFLGDDTKVFVGKSGFKGTAFVPGEIIYDWISTSQLDI